MTDPPHDADTQLQIEYTASAACSSRDHPKQSERLIINKARGIMGKRRTMGKEPSFPSHNPFCLTERRGQRTRYDRGEL